MMMLTSKIILTHFMITVILIKFQCYIQAAKRFKLFCFDLSIE